jgi:hypothetical protein
MDIVYEPYRKITTRNYIRHENGEAFAATLQSIQKGTGLVGNLFWANKILFRYFGFALTDSINKEYLQGHLPIDLLEFAAMSRFRKEIRAGDFIVTVIDVSGHHMHNILTKWISGNLITDNSENRA